MKTNTRLPRILVVDDEISNLEIIEEYLDDEHCLLLTQSSSLEAWKILESGNENFDLILLDWMMPELDGLALLKRIKQQPALKNVPVIMQTARSDEKDLLQGIANGAYYYLTKPYDQKSLCVVVREALEESRQLQRLTDQLHKTKKPEHLKQSARFKFQSLSESHDLAMLLANACPDPDKVLSGINELFTNAIEHGNLGIGYYEKARLKHDNTWHEEIEKRITLPEYSSKFVDVDFEHNGNHISMTISDQGKGFDWNNYLDFDPARLFDCNGRGIAMAKMLSFDSIEYIGNGNTVIARIDLPNSTKKNDE